MRTHHHRRPPQNKVSDMSKEYSKMIWEKLKLGPSGIPPIIHCMYVGMMKFGPSPLQIV